MNEEQRELVSDGVGRKVPSAGRVCLVGAGPGDPGLITLRGVERLREADAVLYDYLANPQILEFVKEGAEVICLGQHGRTRIWTQPAIHDRMIELARQGKQVVRLKNGDPAIFARGAEEMQALVDAGIPFEVVPGITAALAAGSHAGIPVTHRDWASAVAFVTGQQQKGSNRPSLDYEALARFPGTLVFYMGVTTVSEWTSALIRAGKPVQTPAAIVRRCSFPDQEVIHCCLGEVTERLAPIHGIRPPVVVILGEVTRLAETFSWFERRPLFGCQILVTRPRDQAGKLVDLLVEQGACALQQPAIEIGPPTDWEPVDNVLARISEFDWLVFSSANGVQYLLERLLSQGGDLRSLSGVSLAVIGSGTRDALAAYHLRADQMPETFRAESLADRLAENAARKRFLLARASRGREVLAERLSAAGGEVEQVVVYQSEDCKTPDSRIVERLRAGQIDYVTITSSAIARALATLFGEDLLRAKLVSISPITSDTLRQLGMSPDIEASEYTMQGIVDAILEDVRNV